MVCGSRNQNWATRALDWPPIQRRRHSTAARKSTCASMDGCRWTQPTSCKVALEEPPGNRPLSDEIVSRARHSLFGSWEMNWMTYNYGQDVDLPGSASTPLVFFMYPQAETSEGRIDPLDPE